MRVLLTTLLTAMVALGAAMLTPVSAAPAGPVSQYNSPVAAPAVEKATYGYGYRRGWRHRGYGWGGYGYRPYYGYGYGYRRHWRPRYYGYGYRRGWRRDYW